MHTMSGLNSTGALVHFPTATIQGMHIDVWWDQGWGVGSAQAKVRIPRGWIAWLGVHSGSPPVRLTAPGCHWADSVNPSFPPCEGGGGGTSTRQQAQGLR